MQRAEGGIAGKGAIVEDEREGRFCFDEVVFVRGSPPPGQWMSFELICGCLGAAAFAIRCNFSF